VLAGRYCHACGQKRIEPQERRFSWFIEQLLKALTMADSRFLGSVGRVVFRPGALDGDWPALAKLPVFLLACGVAHMIYRAAQFLVAFSLS
jgi:hypothetical protein